MTNGKDGKSIESVELEDGAEYDGASGAANTYECKDSDGNVVGTFTVKNGAQGQSIEGPQGPRGYSVNEVRLEDGTEYDDGSQAQNTYEVLTEDGTVVGTFTTTNGKDGNGIQSITLTQTVGKVKTYTITFTDNTTTTFNVTDGNDGEDGTWFSLYRIGILPIPEDTEFVPAEDYQQSQVGYYKYINEAFSEVKKWGPESKAFEESSAEELLAEITESSGVVDVCPSTEPMEVATNMLYGVFATFDHNEINPGASGYPNQHGNGFTFGSVRQLPLIPDSPTTNYIYFTVKVYHNIK